MSEISSTSYHVRHTVHFTKHHLGPTRVFAHPSHRTSLPTRTILRRKTTAVSFSYDSIRQSGSGHSTRTTKVFSCVTNRRLDAEASPTHPRSARKLRTTILVSPSPTLRGYSSPILRAREGRSPRPSSRQSNGSPITRGPLLDITPLSPPSASQSNIPFFSEQSIQHRELAAPPILDIYAPNPVVSPIPSPRFLNQGHKVAAPTSPYSNPSMYAPPLTPIILHPELTSHCPLIWTVYSTPMQARSRYPVAYPYDLDFLSTPACPGASTLLIRIPTVAAWMDRWGPIVVGLRLNAFQISVYDVLSEIYSYLHTRLTPDEEMQHVRGRETREIVYTARSVRLGLENGGNETEWELPPMRADVIAPWVGCDFVSLQSHGVGVNGAVEMSLRLDCLY
ncbi:hypothetical protein PM082_015408 [Marasmius tenuissimus]|nr:hypothetical protein PM082_015408 [Marasmius tenuissimus]